MSFAIIYIQKMEKEIEGLMEKAQNYNKDALETAISELEPSVR